MPRGGGSGRKKFGHKGGTRHFTNAHELAAQQQQIKEEKEREGDESDDDEKKKAGKKKASDESSSSEDEGGNAAIDVHNPNRVKQKTKKVTELENEAADAQQPMNRKEREAVEAERARQHYLKLHEQGKTDEAQRDLARLELVRKQREEAAKKREEEKLAKEKASASKAPTNRPVSAGMASTKAHGKGRKK